MAEKVDYDRHFDADIYDKDYFEGDKQKSGYDSYVNAKGIVTDEYGMFVKTIAGRIETGAALDLGCAYGYGADTLRRAGFNPIVGVDISPWAIDKANELFGGMMEFKVGDVADKKLWDKFSDKQFKLITSTEMLEHIESASVPLMIKQMARVAEWGIFVFGARTQAGQDAEDILHCDHGHLNNHNLSWWVTEFAKHGEIDWDMMFEFNKLAEAYNRQVHWHCRCIIVKFTV